ncbi:uncharacterized protein LOC108602832 [Drosophila busckii]|uniref:uncharacterized protein LOC108602832 n=1 Tax=Drosophila busckii TaxID=30019 RepID=UPI00083EC9F0|nr:uncharacterized protein LOC108602832 [Drosophila busckii]
MPLESLIISLDPESKNINVLLVHLDEQEKKQCIKVTEDGLRWLQANYEQFVPLDDYVTLLSGSAPAFVKVNERATLLKLNPLSIEQQPLEEQISAVAIKPLPCQLTEAMSFKLRCNHCNLDLVSQRSFSCIRPVPKHSMQPNKVFFSENMRPLYPSQLYYGLNFIVVNACVLDSGYKRCNERIHCNRCLQQLGELLQFQPSALLFVDTICISNIRHLDLRMRKYIECPLQRLFRPLSATQLLLRLLQNATPNGPDQLRIFLKTVDEYGQLQYMLLRVDNRLRHLLRPKLSHSERRELLKEKNKALEQATQLMHVINVKSLLARCIRYNYFRNDEQLSAHDEMIQEWRKVGIPMLRIAHDMMMTLNRELQSNMYWVPELEHPLPAKTDGRLSYIIYSKN